MFHLESHWILTTPAYHQKRTTAHWFPFVFLLTDIHLGGYKTYTSKPTTWSFGCWSSVRGRLRRNWNVRAKTRAGLTAQWARSWRLRYAGSDGVLIKWVETRVDTLNTVIYKRWVQTTTRRISMILVSERLYCKKSQTRKCLRKRREKRLFDGFGWLFLVTLRCQRN